MVILLISDLDVTVIGMPKSSSILNYSNNPYNFTLDIYLTEMQDIWGEMLPPKI